MDIVAIRRDQAPMAATPKCAATYRNKKNKDIPAQQVSTTEKIELRKTFFIGRRDLQYVDYPSRGVQ